MAHVHLYLFEGSSTLGFNNVTTWDNYFSAQEQVSRKIHLRRHTEKENAVIAHLHSLTATNQYPGRINPLVIDHAQVRYVQIRYGPYNGYRMRGFRMAFPQCELMWWLSFHHYFYIKRHYYNVGNQRTVHFIASAIQQTVNIISDAQFNQFLAQNSWFARATCVNGEITHVEVANRLETGVGCSAKRCGFGTSLLYLCFLNTEHLDDPQGYRINQNPMFLTGNMPQIKRYMQNYCTRIIYVHYQRRVLTPFQPPSAADPGDMVDAGAGSDGGRCRDKPTHWMPERGMLTEKENKAFIYAATAANYIYMITFNPTPCNQGCCAYRTRSEIPDGEHPLVTDNPHWKVFALEDILSDFNKHDPRSLNIHPAQEHTVNEPNYWQTREFARHHGRDWFFCKF